MKGFILAPSLLLFSPKPAPAAFLVAPNVKLPATPVAAPPTAKAFAAPYAPVIALNKNP